MDKRSKDLTIQEQADQLADLQSSRIVGPAIRLRDWMRCLVRNANAKISAVEARVMRFSKKHLNQGSRDFINPILPRKYRIQTVHVTNELWEGPLISIVTPHYNQGTFLSDTVESVLHQTFQNFEYIIVDDGSTDEDSRRAFDRIEHKKIRKLKQSNQGVAAARNLGISVSKGKYILCLDSDDQIDPTYVEKALILLETRPNVDIVYSHMRFFGIEERIYKEPEFDASTLYTSNIMTTAAIFRRNAWEQVGGFKSGIGFEDWEFWINLVENGSVAALLPEPLFLYRRAALSRYVEDKKREEENVRVIHSLHPNYKRAIQRRFRDAAIKRYKFERKSQFINLENPALYRKSKEKKNVLLVMPWLTFGGAEMVTYNYCSRLQDDFNLFVVTGIKSENEWEYRFKEFSDSIYHLPNIISDASQYDDFLVEFVKTRGIDVIHSVHNSVLYPMLLRIKTEFPEIRIISTVFNEHSDHFENSLENSCHIDRFVTDNAVVKRAYADQNIDNVSVIPNGIDCWKKFNPALYDRHTQRRKLGLEADDMAVFFIGRLSPEKNPDVFVRAAAMVIERCDNARFFIIGDGPMRGEIERMLSKIADSRLKFLGYQSDIPLYLCSADIFVLPSKIEGCPSSNIEAMAMGVCVISTDVGGVRDAVQDGKTGFLVSPNSAKEIADKILEVGGNAALLSLIRKNARKLVEERFSVDRLSESYRNLYSE